MAATVSNYEEELSQILKKQQLTDDVTVYEDVMNYCTDVTKELSGEPLKQFYAILNKKIYSLCNSPHKNERLDGVGLIEHLIDVDLGDNTPKITRFANFLRLVLNTTDATCVAAAAHAMGKLCKEGGTLTGEILEFELKRSFEWLQGIFPILDKIQKLVTVT